MTREWDRLTPEAQKAARYYTGPQIFEIEKDGRLARSWQFPCHANQLENPGDYVASDLGSENLFSIKGRDGETRTFYNVCQHRVHQLVSGEGSTRVVVCLYHAWTYELTGSCAPRPTRNWYLDSTPLKSA